MIIFSNFRPGWEYHLPPYDLPFVILSLIHQYSTPFLTEGTWVDLASCLTSVAYILSYHTYKGPVLFLFLHFLLHGFVEGRKDTNC